jgi:hypothetical protein
VGTQPWVQRTLYAAGRYWIFYWDSDNFDYLYRSTPNLSTWSDPGYICTSCTGNYFDLDYNESHLYYVYTTGGPAGEPITYRAYVPNSDGSLTQVAAQTIFQQVDVFTYPGLSITVDEDNHPWIAYVTRPVGETFYDLYVTTSSTTPGWTTRSGFPYLIDSSSRVYPYLLPLTGGKMYILWGRYYRDIYGRLWNGTGWESTETIKLNVGGDAAFSAVSIGDVIHLVYWDDDPQGTYYMNWTYTSGWSEAYQLLPTSVSARLLLHDATIYLLWANSTDENIYYIKWVGGVWDTTPALWIDESLNIAGGFIVPRRAHEDKITSAWVGGKASPYSIRYAKSDVSCGPPNFGDWHIIGNCEIENRDFMVPGDVYVESDGILNLKGTTNLAFSRHWQYRKSHIIQGSTAGSLYDYVLNITVYNTTGTDSGHIVYVGDKARPDFGDIRFTDSSGKVLSYWIEEIGSNYARFWVKIPNIPTSPDSTTIYMYYGNPDATSVSSISATCSIYGEDFEDDPVGQLPGGWDLIGATVDVQNDRARSGSKSLRGDNAATEGYSAWVNFTTTEKIRALLWIQVDLAGRGGMRLKEDGLNKVMTLLRADVGDWRYNDAGTWSTIPNQGSSAPDIWYRVEMLVRSTAREFNFRRDSQLWSGWIGGYEAATSGINQFQVRGNYNYDSGYTWHDDICIMPYTEPEPSHGAWGSEETLYWQYRKSHIIQGSTAGSLYDYVLNITVYNTTGTDSGHIVYVGDKARPDFGDIRFTDSSGKVLSYWIEEIGSNYARFWVKIPNIPTSPDSTTIYMYYGNPDATSVSNGENTFLLFDDFPGTSLDTSKWQEWKQASASISVSDGLLNLTSPPGTDTSCYIKSVANWSEPLKAEMKVKVTGADKDSSNLFGLELGVDAAVSSTGGNTLDTGWVGFFSEYTGWGDLIRERSGGTTIDDVTDNNAWVYTLGEWIRVELIMRHDSATYIANGYSVTNTNETVDYTTNENSLFVWVNSWGGATTTAYQYVDWIFLRKYADPEPSHGAWGSEETSGFYIHIHPNPNGEIYFHDSDSYIYVYPGGEIYISDTAGFNK